MFFTGVCDSVNGGGGVSASVHAGIPPRADPPEQTPPGADTPSPRSRHPPHTQEQTPRKQTPVYGQRAAGTHPTGMHSCCNCIHHVI